MGMIQHDFLIVTSGDEDDYKFLEQLAEDKNYPCHLFDAVTNGQRTLFYTTSGSKEGWPTQERHSAKLDEVLRLVKAHNKRTDGFVTVARVGFGELGNYLMVED